MNLYLKKDIRRIEKYLIDDLGVSSLILMEHAARSVFEELKKEIDNIKDADFLIAVGKGNNGGDAYSLARMMLSEGLSVSIFDVFGEPQSPDSIIQKRLLTESLKKVEFLKEKDLLRNIENKIVVDGVFGIGFSGELADKLKDIFVILNKAKHIISIDTPSGVCVDTGKVAKGSVNADLTVSFFIPKQGLYTIPASQFVGKIVNKRMPFAIPFEIICSSKLMDKKLIKDILKKITPRKSGSHKGSYGELGIIASAKGMEGACSICALGAVKGGAGKVSILSQDRTVLELRQSLPNLSSAVIIKDISLDSLYSKYETIVAGPGFSRSRKSILKRLLDTVVEDKKQNMVFDADALNILSQDPELLAKIRKLPCVLTPHPKEMAELSSEETSKIQANRLYYAKEFVEGSNLTLVLKGANTIVVDKDNNLYISPFDVPALASSGTGDFLAGLIGAFISQGLTRLEASILAVYLSAFGARIYEKEYPDFSMDIFSLARYFVKAIQEISKD